MRVAIFVICLAAGAAGAQAPNLRGSSQIPYCPIVDGGREPLASASLGLAPTETIEDSSETFGFIEAQGRISLGYYRTRAGDFDFALLGRLWITTDGDRYDVPKTFGEGIFRARWDVRTTQGLTLRAEALPGYYAEVEHLEWDDLNMPVTLSGIQAFNKQFAVQAGFALYPGFENSFDPILGIRFVPHRDFTFDLAYPETKGVWRVLPDVTLLGGYQINRVWQFSLNSDSEDGDFMYRDHRLYGGLNVNIGGLMTVTVRGGMLMSREIDFSKGLYQKANVDDGIFLSVGVVGEF